MKAIRKTIGLLLVLVMAASLETTAFAAGGGSITVENPKAGETYTAYLIFDVVYNEDQSAYSYTIAADSQWLGTVQAYPGITLRDPVTDGDGNSFYIVTKMILAQQPLQRRCRMDSKGKPVSPWHLQMAKHL